MSPFQHDLNWGLCTIPSCPNSRERTGIVQTFPRCSGFACADCCEERHAAWPNHTRAEDPPDSRLPVQYGGGPVPQRVREYDYDTCPLRFGQVEETSEEHAVLLPLTNFKVGSTKFWDIDFIT